MEYHQIHEIIRIPLVVKMLDEGYNPNAYDKYGLTPLHYCENPELAEVLISRGASPTTKSNDYNCMSPLDSCEFPEVKEVYLRHLSSVISVSD